MEATPGGRAAARFLAIGALWEVAERGFDRVAPVDVIKGKHDTVIDAVMDTFGALAAGGASLQPLAPRGTRPGAAPAATPEAH